MGNCCRSYKFCGKSENNITLLLTGLDNAGKTTIAKKLAGESIDSVLRTVGFSLVVIHHHGFKITLYDLGGGNQIRDIWNKYFMDAHGIIYVVDSCDMSRLRESKSVFATLLSHENISGKPVLLLANKQDMEQALDELEIVEHMNVESVVNEFRCPTRVEVTTALQLETSKIDRGIKNGFRWLVNYIIQNYKVLNERVKHDMADYNIIVQKKREEWKKKTEAIKEQEEETIFENGNPFKAIDTAIKNSIEKNIINVQNGSVRKPVLIDNFVKQENETIIQDKYLKFSVKSEAEVPNTFEVPRIIKGKEKRNHRHHRHRRKFKKLNKTAPMPINEVLKLQKLSNGKERGISNYSVQSCLTYGADLKKNQTRKLLPCRPATAPPKLHFSKVKVKAAWDLAPLHVMPGTSTVEIFTVQSNNSSLKDGVYY